jgi:hypothetical protein
MAREPKFIFKDYTFSASLNKVDRDKVYGWTETKYMDSNGKSCNFISILDDGKTIIASKGLAYKTLDQNGVEIDKSTLIAKNTDGTEALLLASVFDVDNILSDDKGIQDYLSLDVKSVYQLALTDNDKGIVDLLNDKKVLYFTFNYRAGYEADDAFLINQGDNIFAVIGKITSYTYATLDVMPTLVDEVEEVSDEVDFSFN